MESPSVYDVYAGGNVRVPQWLVFTFMWVHAAVYATLVLSTLLILPFWTRVLNIATNVMITVGFAWFGKCWLLELERRLLKRNSDHIFLQFFYLFPRKVRRMTFVAIQCSTIALGLSMLYLGL